jgi:hypothetical protein
MVSTQILIRNGVDLFFHGGDEVEVYREDRAGREDGDEYAV